MRPLDGITVIALEHAIAAPFCTRQLADLGARVIKIERPEVGDFARHYDERVLGLASHFVWINRSKESLALNIKHPSARPILDQLLQGADILVQNLVPGASERLGLSYAELSKRFPKLIVCDISGYGDGGPYRDRKAYDLLIQSESGFLSVTGSPDAPAKAGNSIADISAGMYAFSNILTALIARSRTGQGCRIDISLLETMVEWMGFPMYYAFDGAEPPKRNGASHATIEPYGPFSTGDGSTTMLGLQNDREWQVFCEAVLCHPELVQDPRFANNSRRVANRQVLHTLINEVFRDLDSTTLRERLDRAGIANAKVNQMSDVWAHPQLNARKRWMQVMTPAGVIPTLRPPGMPDGIEPRMDPVPAVGGNTDAILRELGYQPMDIEQLRCEHVI